MTYIVSTPVGTDRYSLVSDLRVLADDVVANLQTVDDKYANTVKNGDSPTFLTVSTSSPPTFPSITVNGSRPLSKISNDLTYGFGLKSENIYLTTKNGANWSSNAHITVPDGGTGSQVINRNALDIEVNSLQGQVTSLASRVSAIESVYATQAYVNSAVSSANSGVAALNAKVDSLTTAVNAKANYYQRNNKVWDSQNAAYASSAGSASSAGYATGAGTASNSDKFAGRRLALGRVYYGSLGGDKTGEKTITHNLGYVPVILANAYNDTGIMSIACSIGAVNSSTAVIKFKNLNNSTSESFSINWMAI